MWVRRRSEVIVVNAWSASLLHQRPIGLPLNRTLQLYDAVSPPIGMVHLHPAPRVLRKGRTSPMSKPRPPASLNMSNSFFSPARVTVAERAAGRAARDARSGCPLAAGRAHRLRRVDDMPFTDGECVNLGLPSGVRSARGSCSRVLVLASVMGW